MGRGFNVILSASLVLVTLTVRVVRRRLECDEDEELEDLEEEVALVVLAVLCLRHFRQV